MNANELADAMEIRASIRRQATSRKSVQEGANDRLADQLDQAATMLRQQQAEIEALKANIVAIEKNMDYWADKSAKTLSIGEIHAVWAAGKYYELDKDGQVDVINFTEFAYAILRKAQEK